MKRTMQSCLCVDFVDVLQTTLSERKYKTEVKRACPPGPELLEKDSSTMSLDIPVGVSLNAFTHASAAAFSFSFFSSESAGGFGRGGGVVLGGAVGAVCI